MATGQSIINYCDCWVHIVSRINILVSLNAFLFLYILYSVRRKVAIGLVGGIHQPGPGATYGVRQHSCGPTCELRL